MDVPESQRCRDNRQQETSRTHHTKQPQKSNVFPLASGQNRRGTSLGSRLQKRREMRTLQHLSDGDSTPEFASSCYPFWIAPKPTADKKTRSSAGGGEGQDCENEILRDSAAEAEAPPKCAEEKAEQDGMVFSLLEGNRIRQNSLLELSWLGIR